jgi:hypothetical protein
LERRQQGKSMDLSVAHHSAIIVVCCLLHETGAPVEYVMTLVD